MASALETRSLLCPLVACGPSGSKGTLPGLNCDKSCHHKGAPRHLPPLSFFWHSLSRKNEKLRDMPNAGTWATGRKSAFKLSGSSARPAYPGFMVMYTYNRQSGNRKKVTTVVAQGAHEDMAPNRRFRGISLPRNSKTSFRCRMAWAKPSACLARAPP